MSRRTNWEFEYTAAKLADAAREKRVHHSRRSKFWEDKKSEVIAKIKECGMEVHDSLSATNTSNRSAGYGAQIVIDSTLQRDLNEAVAKIDEHYAKMVSYECWVQVLEANPESRLRLDHDDFIFFFGK